MLHRSSLSRRWLLASHAGSWLIWMLMAIALVILPFIIGPDPVVDRIDLEIFKSGLSTWGAGVIVAIASVVEAVALTRRRGVGGDRPNWRLCPLFTAGGSSHVWAVG